ncbi:hypothetical protein MGWOODY_XGa2945 [hydrothermal vent metagenome]|uniref:Uncharacterized protein n=1 Tax=hydrothermal vent metagenome TaxID=652676 RepID=A0A160TTB3_9ZZZZ
MRARTCRLFLQYSSYTKLVEGNYNRFEPVRKRSCQLG